MSGEVEQILLLLARRRQLGEIVGVDDHVAGRTGHHAFARAFERLAGGPGDVEQPLPRRGLDFLVERSVRPEKPHRVMRRAAPGRGGRGDALAASTSSCWLV